MADHEDLGPAVTKPTDSNPNASKKINQVSGDAQQKNQGAADAMPKLKEGSKEADEKAPEDKEEKAEAMHDKEDEKKKDMKAGYKEELDIKADVDALVGDSDLSEEFNFDLFKIIKHLAASKNENGKLLIRESRVKTIKKKYDPYLQIYKQNNQSESFANWYYENKLLGYSYNKSLKEIFSQKIRNLKTSTEIEDESVGSTVFMVAKVDKSSQWISRSEKKTRTMKLILSDQWGTIPLLAFNDKIDYIKTCNDDNLPKENDIVIVKGQKKQDCLFAETVSIQTLKIYTKLSELKNLEKEKSS